MKTSVYMYLVRLKSLKLPQWLQQWTKTQTINTAALAEEQMLDSRNVSCSPFFDPVWNESWHQGAASVRRGIFYSQLLLSGPLP